MSGRPIPHNRFYNDFDCQFFSPRKGEDYRTPFQRDRDRIIYSSALRRLQAKTQVFLSGEYDFYRTRLTHSIEVAQIGRSICHSLRQKGEPLGEDFFVDPDLVEAICLSHDLGHPPFGHSGEETLNELMTGFGGFEGNAHTLRMLTEIIYPDGPGRTGMKPTRALMDGVLKYKTRYSDHPDQPPQRHFVYDDQQRYLDFVFDGRPFPPELTPGKARNAFRSVECQIMDWADDSAYSLNDILDGVNARFITRERLEKWGEEQSLGGDSAVWVSEVLRKIHSGNLEKSFSSKIGDFIAACRTVPRENFMSDLSNRYAFCLEIDPSVRAEAALYKKMASDIVFNSPQLQQLRYKWNNILRQLFEALRDNYLGEDQPIKLLSDIHHQRVVNAASETEKMRELCDYVAGMTDRFVLRAYRRLFDPGFGSILDFV